MQVCRRCTGRCCMMCTCCRAGVQVCRAAVPQPTVQVQPGPGMMYCHRACVCGVLWRVARGCVVACVVCVPPLPVAPPPLAPPPPPPPLVAPPPPPVRRSATTGMALAATGRHRHVTSRCACNAMHAPCHLAALFNAVMKQYDVVCHNSNSRRRHGTCRPPMGHGARARRGSDANTTLPHASAYALHARNAIPCTCRPYTVRTHAWCTIPQCTPLSPHQHCHYHYTPPTTAHPVGHYHSVAMVLAAAPSSSSYSTSTCGRRNRAFLSCPFAPFFFLPTSFAPRLRFRSPSPAR